MPPPFASNYGPWAVVAGASEGLGAAFASALAARGVHLLLLARRAELLESVAEGLRARAGVQVRTAVCDMALRLADRDGIDTIALTGGCFQNKVLFEACVEHIEAHGLTCLTQTQVTTNDGGLSLGQAAIAAAREIAAATET